MKLMFHYLQYKKYKYLLHYENKSKCIPKSQSNYLGNIFLMFSINNDAECFDAYVM